MRLFIVTICIAVMALFAPLEASARPPRPPCPKVWIEGHYNKHGRWIKGHWKRQHWVSGHYNRAGVWVPGHCK